MGMAQINRVSGTAIPGGQLGMWLRWPGVYADLPALNGGMNRRSSTLFTASRARSHIKFSRCTKHIQAYTRTMSMVSLRLGMSSLMNASWDQEHGRQR